MPSFQTDFMGYSIEYSPFEENKIAVSTAQHFGIIGNGKQYILENTPYGIKHIVSYDTRDGVYDNSWSECNENHLVSAGGDGSVKMWDLKSTLNPIRSFEEHSAEVYSVDYNLVEKERFISGSWDDSIKLWHPERPGSIRTFREHTYCVYTVSYFYNSICLFKF